MKSVPLSFSLLSSLCHAMKSFVSNDLSLPLPRFYHRFFVLVFSIVITISFFLHQRIGTNAYGKQHSSVEHDLLHEIETDLNGSIKWIVFNQRRKQLSKDGVYQDDSMCFQHVASSRLFFYFNIFFSCIRSTLSSVRTDEICTDELIRHGLNQIIIRSTNKDS